MSGEQGRIWDSVEFEGKGDRQEEGVGLELQEWRDKPHLTSPLSGSKPLWQRACSKEDGNNVACPRSCSTARWYHPRIMLIPSLESGLVHDKRNVFEVPCMTSKAKCGGPTWRLPGSHGTLAKGAASHHVRGTTSLRPPCCRKKIRIN